METAGQKPGKTLPYVKLVQFFLKGRAQVLKSQLLHSLQDAYDYNPWFAEKGIFR